MTPPHLRDANCCHTCRYGYGSGINPGACLSLTGK